jgi:hypothetical protein
MDHGEENEAQRFAATLKFVNGGYKLEAVGFNELHNGLRPRRLTGC